MIKTASIPVTVLFVDNDRTALRSAINYSPDSALTLMRTTHADEALDLIISKKISVVISDNHIPGMKGRELLSKARKLSPVTVGVLMVDYDDLSTAVDAIYREDAYRFIVKPLDDRNLVRVMNEAVKRHHYICTLEQIDATALLSVAQGIEMKDSYTKGHCERVAGYALMMARALGLSEEMTTFIEYGSWLHDCGKIHMPRQILNHSGALRNDDYDIMKNHPVWGAEIAKYAQLPEQIINIVLHHHERYDGYGYPFGLKKSEIPLEAHIVSIADIFDALTTDRPYRNKYSFEKAVGLMVSMRGGTLDPAIADIFLYDCLAKLR